MDNIDYQRLRERFVEEYRTSLIVHGETGVITLEERPFRLVLHGPPWRQRALKRAYGDYCRATEHERKALIERLGARRFGNDFTTPRQDAITDLDMRHDAVHCCGDEDLILLRCPQCERAWIWCYECDTEHLPDVLGAIEARARPATDDRCCPFCRVRLPCDTEALLPTRGEVRAAGLSWVLEGLPR